MAFSAWRRKTRPIARIRTRFRLSTSRIRQLSGARAWFCRPIPGSGLGGRPSTQGARTGRLWPAFPRTSRHGGGSPGASSHCCARCGVSSSPARERSYRPGCSDREGVASILPLVSIRGGRAAVGPSGRLFVPPPTSKLLRWTGVQLGQGPGESIVISFSRRKSPPTRS